VFTDFLGHDKMFREGDIVEIPLPSGNNAIGRILHLSTHFKNAIGFVVYGLKDQFDLGTLSLATPSTLLGPLYTHTKAAEHYGWKIVGHQPLIDEERLMTKRNVGECVYVADDYLGTIDELWEHESPKMLLMGMPVVWSEVEKWSEHNE
jgi:hypothetical protein